MLITRPCGLAQCGLQPQGFAKLSIRVNVLGEWKWVILDLEDAGRDGEEGEGDGFVNWDAGTLEDRNGGKC